jgi:hypothetical protein
MLAAAEGVNQGTQTPEATTTQPRPPPVTAEQVPAQEQADVQQPPPVCDKAAISAEEGDAFDGDVEESAWDDDWFTSGELPDAQIAAVSRLDFFSKQNT